MEVSIIQKQEDKDKDTDKLHDVQRLFSSKYYLTFPQYGKHQWIGVFKSKRLGLGGCAGILVQTLLPPLLISWSKDTAATSWLIRLFKLWHRSRLIDSQKVAMTLFLKIIHNSFPSVWQVSLDWGFQVAGHLWQQTRRLRWHIGGSKLVKTMRSCVTRLSRIITAAHCASIMTKKTMSIVLGEFDISSSTDVLE